jgi:hypothetical protein
MHHINISPKCRLCHISLSNVLPTTHYTHDILVHIRHISVATCAELPPHLWIHHLCIYCKRDNKQRKWDSHIQRVEWQQNMMYGYFNRCSVSLIPPPLNSAFPSLSISIHILLLFILLLLLLLLLNVVNIWKHRFKFVLKCTSKFMVFCSIVP